VAQAEVQSDGAPAAQAGVQSDAAPVAQAGVQSDAAVAAQEADFGWGDLDLRGEQVGAYTTLRTIVLKIWPANQKVKLLTCILYPYLWKLPVFPPSDLSELELMIQIGA